VGGGEKMPESERVIRWLLPTPDPIVRISKVGTEKKYRQEMENQNS